MKKLSLMAIVLLTLMACKSDPNTSNYDWLGMVGKTSPQVDSRFAESMQYNEAHPIADICVPAEDYRVYVMTDTHVDSTTYNLDSIVRAANMDEECRLVLHLGDVVNAQNHYGRFDQAVRRCTKPLFIADGNHDLYFNQWTEFRKYYGTATYAFTVVTPAGQRDRYICLDTGSGTLGKDQRKWFGEQLAQAKKDQYRHITVFTHTHIFKQDKSQGHTDNYALEETYELLNMMSQNGVSLVLMGHDHSREISDYGEVRYIVVDSAQDPQAKPFYMILSVGETLHQDFIPLPEKEGGYVD